MWKENDILYKQPQLSVNSRTDKIYGEKLYLSKSSF